MWCASVVVCDSQGHSWWLRVKKLPIKGTRCPSSPPQTHSSPIRAARLVHRQSVSKPAPTCIRLKKVLCTYYGVLSIRWFRLHSSIVDREGFEKNTFIIPVFNAKAWFIKTKKPRRSLLTKQCKTWRLYAQMTFTLDLSTSPYLSRMTHKGWLTSGYCPSSLFPHVVTPPFFRLTHFKLSNLRLMEGHYVKSSPFFHFSVCTSWILFLPSLLLSSCLSPSNLRCERWRQDRDSRREEWRQHAFNKMRHSCFWAIVLKRRQLSMKCCTAASFVRRPASFTEKSSAKATPVHPHSQLLRQAFPLLEMQFRNL